MIIDIILDRREGAINYSPYDNQALMIVSYNSKNNLTRYENLIN